MVGGIPENRIQECVWTVLLAMGGEEVRRSCHGGNRLVQVLRHDRVRGGLLHDGEDGSPRPSVKAPGQLRLPFETILSSRQSCAETWKALNGLVKSQLHRITALWVDGMNEQAPETRATTMVDDRKLYAVGTEKLRILEEAIDYTKK